MSETKPRKQKYKEPKVQPAPSGAERLKTVVRWLPPNLPEVVFWQSVQTWVTDDTITWKSYYPGKFRTKRANKEGVPSRAYIAFKDEALVARFSREYDGHVFRDKAGNESQALVEFAPFQKIPTEKKKNDARNNTIDRDEDYISFLESLKGKTESVSLETLIAASQSPPAPKTTPLLEALKAEKLAQKDKETILRSHAHYKDAGVSKKEEAKKKAATVAVQAKVETPAVVPTSVPVPLSKKARKAVAASTVPAATPAVVVPPKTPATQDGPGKQPASSAPKAPPAPSTPSVAGHGRRRAKDHRQSQPAKGEPAPVTENAASQRKTRPVVGLGRGFEAALNGAVAVSPPPGPSPAPPDRKVSKSRDASVRVTDKGKRREDAQVVPSILQRPEGEVVIMQRAVSPKVGTGGEAGVSAGTGVAAGAAGPGPGVRDSRRGRGQKGRGPGTRGG